LKAEVAEEVEEVEEVQGEAKEGGGGFLIVLIDVL